MAALTNDSAMLQHIDRIGVDRCRKAVCYHNDSLFAMQPVHDILDNLLVDTVQIGCQFIQQYDICFGKQGARHCDALFFSA